MGKDTKKNDFTSMSDILEEQKKLKKKLGKIQISCSHTNDKGKLKVDFIDNNRVRCKRCNCEFSFNKVEASELKKAIDTIHNVTNQIKALSQDPTREKDVIISLGQMDYNIKELNELYSRTMSNFGKGNKKKKNNDDQFGSYGVGSIDFIGGKKKKY